MLRLVRRTDFARQGRRNNVLPPHAIEPKYPGVFEQPINLACCWDVHKLFASREEVMTLGAKISRCHEHCCRFLGAAHSLLTDTYRIALDATGSTKIAQAAQRIAQTEFHGGQKRRGKEAIRFLSAVTNKGFTQFNDTAQTLCNRIYCIEDVYGASARLLLNALRASALEAGFDIISCYCPLSPFEKLEHFFVPTLGLGFMTVNDYHPAAIAEPYKIVRARRFTDGEQIKKSRKRIAFNKKAAAQMLDQAVRLLSEAKELHDQLEWIYKGAMDFSKVDEIQKATLNQCLELVEKKR